MKWIKLTLSLTPALILCACTTTTQIHDGPPTAAFDASKVKPLKAHPLKKSRYGNPKSYVIDGRRYHVLKTAKGYDKRGVGSWYGTKFHGQRTSSGEPYNMFALTAANRILPIPTYARVTNLENGRSIIVKINDRGPFAHDRIIDLSYAAAKKLGYAHKGTAHVEVKAITFDKQQPHHIQRYLQVASFKDEDNAKALKSRLRRLTRQPVQVQETYHLQNTLFRVQIGPIKSAQQSAKLRELVEDLGLGKPITIAV